MGLAKRDRFAKIVKDIKEVKIQGARNVAKAALHAYFLLPSTKSRSTLLRSRPTEPMMEHVLSLAKKLPEKQILKHFDDAQDKINKFVYSVIDHDDVIFTHCHSTNVVNALIYAKKKGKKFEVYNTETRPLYQGRKTASELKKAGIKVTMFIDSALGVSIIKESKNDKTYAKKIFLGADALLKNGIINKIGSGLITEIAYNHKIPVYIIADSWKYTNRKVPIEQRNLNEVWDKAPKNVKIKNPAFEFVKKKHVKAIISEHGVLSYDKFIDKVNKLR